MYVAYHAGWKYNTDEIVQTLLKPITKYDYDKRQKNRTCES